MRLRTFILLSTLTALLLWAGQALGGGTGICLALGAAAAMNMATYWFANRIVLRMHHAREIHASSFPELHAMVRELCKRANCMATVSSSDCRECFTPRPYC